MARVSRAMVNKRLGDYDAGSTSDLTENFVNTPGSIEKVSHAYASLTVEVVEITKNGCRGNLDFDRSRKFRLTRKKD